MAEPVFAHISCRKEAGILVVILKDQKIQGDDLGDLLRQELLEAVQSYNADQLVIDFQRVTYLSTAGFRPLLSLHRKLHETRGRMIFCNLMPETLEVFVVTRLISPTRVPTAPFEAASDLADALARFRHHTCRLEDGVLAITITESKLQGDELADSLNDHLLATVTQAQAKKVALDFRHVDRIATACLRPLLNLRNHLHARGGRLILCNLHPQVAEVLSVTRLTSTTGVGPVPLESATDLQAAIAALKR
jgi:anti-sigma B factor antagonist